MREHIYEHSHAHQSTRLYLFRKLAKSTLVLIPLFGVPYMLFLWVDPKTANRDLEAVKIYYEMIFNSSVVRMNDHYGARYLW